MTPPHPQGPIEGLKVRFHLHGEAYGGGSDAASAVADRLHFPGAGGVFAVAVADVCLGVAVEAGADGEGRGAAGSAAAAAVVVVVVVVADDDGVVVVVVVVAADTFAVR